MSPKAWTQERFLQEAVAIHGETYDYSRVQYVGAHSKVEISHRDCSRSFQQKPTDHLAGKGCPHCFGCAGKTTLWFVEKAQGILGGSYDYSLVNYQGTKIPVRIIHRTCGRVFENKPFLLLRGSGCPDCDGPVTNSDQFLLKARKVHGLDYEYPELSYQHNKAPIRILHRACGKVFEQTSSNHLKGTRCPHCFKSPLVGFEEFLKRAQEVHGSDYDYSLVAYKGVNHKVKILHNCGEFFEQTPANHLQGFGCPCQSRSRGEVQVEKYLSVRGVPFEKQVSFEDLRNPRTNRKLRFDFQVLDTLIEFDGKQHLQPVRFNGCSIESATKNFESIKYRDGLKEAYCSSKGLKLLRITSFEEIDQKLMEVLNA